METIDNNVADNNVKVFGTPQVVNTEIPKDVIPKVETPKEPIETPKPNANQVTDEPKSNEKPVDTPKDVKPKVETPKTDKPKDFKVSFENEIVETPKATNTDNQETVSVTEEVVTKFLKDTYNIEVKELSELSKTEELPESVAKFKKFHEETGRGINDFYNSQKDWDKESKNDTIKEFYKYEYPEMSDEDIDTRLELINVSKDDEDELDARDLKKRQLDYSTEYSKALSFMNKKSKEFKTPMGNKEVQAKQSTPEEIAEAHKPYWEARDKSLNNLKDIKLKIEGVGEINLEVTDEQKKLISTHTETQEAFFGRWQDDKGVINTDKSSLDSGWSIPEIRQAWIASMLEQANTLILENFSKNNRNVKLDKILPVEENESGASMKVVGNSPKQDNKMGTALF